MSNVQQGFNARNAVLIFKSNTECVNCGASYLPRHGLACRTCGTELKYSTTGYFYGGELFADVKQDIEKMFPGLQYMGLAGGMTGCGGEDFHLVPVGARGELHG